MGSFVMTWIETILNSESYDEICRILKSINHTEIYCNGMLIEAEACKDTISKHHSQLKNDALSKADKKQLLIDIKKLRNEMAKLVHNSVVHRSPDNPPPQEACNAELLADGFTYAVRHYMENATFDNAYNEMTRILRRFYLLGILVNAHDAELDYLMTSLLVGFGVYCNTNDYNDHFQLIASEHAPSGSPQVLEFSDALKEIKKAIEPFKESNKMAPWKYFSDEISTVLNEQFSKAAYSVSEYLFQVALEQVSFNQVDVDQFVNHTVWESLRPIQMLMGFVRLYIENAQKWEAQAKKTKLDPAFLGALDDISTQVFRATISLFSMHAHLTPDRFAKNQQEMLITLLVKLIDVWRKKRNHLLLPENNPEFSVYFQTAERYWCADQIPVFVNWLNLYLASLQVNTKHPKPKLTARLEKVGTFMLELNRLELTLRQMDVNIENPKGSVALILSKIQLEMNLREYRVRIAALEIKPDTTPSLGSIMKNARRRVGYPPATDEPDLDDLTSQADTRGDDDTNSDGSEGPSLLTDLFEDDPNFVPPDVVDIETFAPDQRF
jgi:hypothetical protein